MRILLATPSDHRSVTSFAFASDITGCETLMPNLALPTLAAMVPEDIEVRVIDQTHQPIDYDTPWDFVGLTGYEEHAPALFEIAAEFRRRGRLVGIGGPFASLSPHIVRPHADVLFIGEGEEIWPEFLADLRAGSWHDEYRGKPWVDLDRSPLPAWRYMDCSKYFIGCVTASRGCPFQCEFCDSILYLGRQMRYKAPERVVQELKALHRSGFRGAFITDDNFSANRRKAIATLEAIREWNTAQEQPMFLATQLSIDTAQEPALLDLARDAGLRWMNVGIETPSPDALRSVKKSQNVRADLVRDVHAFFEHGIMVGAGMILGFDTDTVDSFCATYEYLQIAGIPTPSFTILNAPDGTPLKNRLRREGRLKYEEAGDRHEMTNVIPKLMTESELMTGMAWLANRVYRPSAFLERVGVVASKMPASGEAKERNALDLWERIDTAYAGLGSGFEEIPQRVRDLFRGKRGMSEIQFVLVAYRHLVAAVQNMGAWNPELGELERPPFAPRSAEEEAVLQARRSGPESIRGLSDDIVSPFV